MSIGAGVMIVAVGLALTALMTQHRQQRRTAAAHKPGRHRQRRDTKPQVMIRITSSDDTPTEPSAMPTLTTLPRGLQPLRDITIEAPVTPEPSPYGPGYVDVAPYITDPDEWMGPLRSGGTRAERRLTQTFRERGMLGVRKLPRRVSRRVKRTLRKEAEHAQ